MNTRQRLYFSFPELPYSLLEFNSRKKLATFDELYVWRSSNSHFEWRFRRRCSLSSLMSAWHHHLPLSKMASIYVTFIWMSPYPTGGILVYMLRVTSVWTNVLFLRSPTLKGLTMFLISRVHKHVLLEIVREYFRAAVSAVNSGRHDNLVWGSKFIHLVFSFLHVRPIAMLEYNKNIKTIIKNHDYKKHKCFRIFTKGPS